MPSKTDIWPHCVFRCFRMKEKLKYGLEDHVPKGEFFVYTLQHIIYFAAGTVVLPIAVGIHLGLEQIQIAELLQRTFFLCGVTTLLQIKLGHLYPIIDGPAGLWASMMIVMAVSTADMGGQMGDLRRNLALGILIAGTIIMVLAATGLMLKLSRLFTPIVNGLIITLMVLQMSATFMKGGLGIDDEVQEIEVKKLIVFMATMLTIIFVSVYLKGFIQSIATLVGVTLGWILAILLGLSENKMTIGALARAPELFAFGAPSFNPGVVISCVLSALVLLSMSFASLFSMAEAVGEQVSKGKLSKTVFLHGLSTLLSGLFSVVPFMPFVSSTGVVLMTRVAARKPFMAACLCMVLFGIFSPVAEFFASMPHTVAYATSMVVFSLIFGQGLKEFKKVTIENRESYVIGISMLCGMGVMFLPDSVFSVLPQSIRFILSNGLVVGTVMAMILEQIFRKGSDKLS